MTSCSRCGEPLESGVMYCTNCGDAVRDGSPGLADANFRESPFATAAKTSMVEKVAASPPNAVGSHTVEGAGPALAEDVPEAGHRTQAGPLAERLSIWRSGDQAAVVPNRDDDGGNARSEALPTDPAEDAARSALAPATTSSHRWLLTASIAALLVALAAATAFGLFWYETLKERNNATATLADVREEKEALELANRELQQDLGNAKRLASQRAVLLDRADKVLGAVEPLLSSVDELQEIAGEMQSERSSYQSASEALKSDLVSLANYLLDVDYAYADWGWVSSMIDEINGEIGTVGYWGGEMSDTDTKYDTATTRFSNRATNLNQSIRALQKQLKAQGR